jgi:hypothetical protein
MNKEGTLGTGSTESHRTSVVRSARAARESESSLLWAPLGVLALTASAIEVPFLFQGTPSGHDVEFHLYSWLEVVGQWKQGIFYPRWASLANFSYGEPRFLFYPPASWTLGAALSALFPWTLAATIYIWIVLIAAGASMFLLARKWLNRRDAIFAAALYAANPYHLVIVYWRSAFAELLASCLLPILLLLVLKTAEDGWRVTAPLGLVLSAAWLTNAPAAVMIHYSSALLLFVIAWKHRSWKPLAIGTVAVLLGAAISAFYLLPAVYEQRWVNIAQAVSAGSRPADNFLFIHTSDADHDAFNRIISWVALAEIGVTLTAAWAVKRWRERGSEIWYALVAWAMACTALMLSGSRLLWDYLPKLRFMQFPWRWLLCLSVVFTILMAVGVRRWWLRIAVCACVLLVVIVSWHRIQPPWWDNAGDLREMQDNVVTGAGYEGTDEYAPLGTDPSIVDKEARRVTVDGPEHAAIRVWHWSPESKSFTAEMSAPSHLAVRLFNYPAWRVLVNDRVVKTGARAGSGQMLVPVERGPNRVEIEFTRTWDRSCGFWISFLALLALLAIHPRSRDFLLQRRAV